MSSPYYLLALLMACCFTLGTTLQPRALSWSKRAQADSVFKVLFGEGRRLFANHFFVEADVYFHSGYYPSIFDQAARPKDSSHMAEVHEEHGGPEDHDEEAHEKAMAFLGKPRDWIEGFGRHFFVTEHTHLSGGTEREILPWLRLSADMDPQRVDTYTVAAFWLRSKLGKVKEAEEFLREGLRNNPDSYEILFELGRLYLENHHDAERARNVWQLALRKWTAQEASKKSPDPFVLEEISVNLARLEEQAGHYQRAIEYLELAKKASPHPEELQREINENKQKLSATPPFSTPPAR